MTNNKQQTAEMNSLQFYITERHELEIKSRYLEIKPDQYGKQLIALEKKAREMYQDEIEAAIIKDCAEKSTSAAHKFSVFREQIIEAFDQGVIAEFTHQVTGALETSGQEYFNQTYGDGVQ
jgi:hypothetical protein